jgi:hypothetical protein
VPECRVQGSGLELQGSMVSAFIILPSAFARRWLWRSFVGALGWLWGGSDVASRWLGGLIWSAAGWSLIAAAGGEIRRPKSEIRTGDSSRGQPAPGQTLLSGFGFRISFGSRPSDFGFGSRAGGFGRRSLKSNVQSPKSGDPFKVQGSRFKVATNWLWGGSPPGYPLVTPWIGLACGWL